MQAKNLIDELKKQVKEDLQMIKEVDGKAKLKIIEIINQKLEAINELVEKNG